MKSMISRVFFGAWQEVLLTIKVSAVHDDGNSWLQPDDVDGLAVEGHVADEEPFLPGFVRVDVEYRHPAFGKPERVEVAASCANEPSPLKFLDVLTSTA